MADQKDGSTAVKQKSSKANNTPIKELQEFPPLFDLGKLKKKHSKKLRKGKDISDISEIQSVVAQVMATIKSENAIPVIISYEQKRKKRKKIKKFRINGWEVDRKKVKERLKKNGLTHPWL